MYLGSDPLSPVFLCFTDSYSQWGSTRDTGRPGRLWSGEGLDETAGINNQMRLSWVWVNGKYASLCRRWLATTSLPCSGPLSHVRHPTSQVANLELQICKGSNLVVLSRSNHISEARRQDRPLHIPSINPCFAMPCQASDTRAS